MAYVDGFVVPVPEDRLDAYRKLARKAGKIWMEHGALQFMECVADDVPAGKTTDFHRSVKRKDGETVIFAFVVYRSRRQRDSVMKKVMEDPRLSADMADMPFDGKRMIFGGFKPIVDLSAD